MVMFPVLCAVRLKLATVEEKELEGRREEGRERERVSTFDFLCWNFMVRERERESIDLRLLVLEFYG